jgi:hypothetical protein
MTVQDEVRDPWSYILSGLAGGFGWAVIGSVAGPAGAVAGLGVGAAVFAAKVLAGAFFRPHGPKRRKYKDRRLPVLTRTPEAAWLARAEAAQHTFDQIAHSAGEGVIAEEVRSFGDQTAESLYALQRLAGQASAIRSAMIRVDPKRLAWEKDRLLNAARTSDHEQVVAERQRALEAVQSQMDAYGRLERTLAMLIARLESGTLGIEGLVARLAEVIALAATSVTATDGLHQVEELAHELEGLRAGLVEAESVSRQAMQGLPAPGNVPTTGERRRARG